jgi:cysteine desulfurase
MKHHNLCCNTYRKPSDRVRLQIAGALEYTWADIDGLHPEGNRTLTEVNGVMNRLRKVLGFVASDTVIPTSSGAEAISHLYSSLYFEVIRMQGKNRLVSSFQEIAPILLGFERLQSLGCTYDLLSPNLEGEINVQELQSLLKRISEETSAPLILSLSSADPLYGTIQPLPEIGTLCKEYGVLFHLDITPTIGKVTLDWEEIQVDAVTCSGAPLGVPAMGFLALRESIQLCPMIEGGGQLQHLRGGEWNWPYIFGFTSALEEMQEQQFWLCSEISRLRDRFEKLAGEELGDRILFPNKYSYRLPNQTVFSVLGVSNELLAFYLQRQGFHVGIGGGQQQQLAQLMRHCGATPQEAGGGICIAFDHEATDEMIEALLQALFKGVEKAILLAEGNKIVQSSKAKRS